MTSRYICVGTVSAKSVELYREAPLRAAVSRKGSRAAFVCAFDLPELDGIDLRREPWETRRATLASLLRKSADGIRLCEHIEGTDGTTILGHACRMGLEGIVAKRRDVSVRAVPGLDQGQTERSSIGRYTFGATSKPEQSGASPGRGDGCSAGSADSAALA